MGILLDDENIAKKKRAMMKKRAIGRSVALGLAVLLVTLVFQTPSFGAEAKKYAIGIGFNFATGDYGTSQTTDSVSVPVTIDYYPSKRLSFELTIPYLYQSNSTTVFAGGMRFSTQRGRRGGMQGTSSTLNVDQSQSGLGDISLTMGYVIQQETKTLPALRPLLYLKFPTADADKGLGTGEFDLGIGLGAVKWFGRWYTFAEGRYVFQGSNADLGLKNYATLEVEGGRPVTDSFLPTVSLWWSSSPSDTSPNLLEARLNGKYWVSDRISLKGYLGTGLSDASPDFDMGAAVYYSF